MDSDPLLGRTENEDLALVRSGFTPSLPTAPPPFAKQSQVKTGRTIMPITVKQINDAIKLGRTRPIVINNTEIITVKIVGRILDANIDGERAEFKIDDGTGQIKAIFWMIYRPNQIQEFKDISMGSYITVHVGLHLIEGIPELAVYACRKVTDFNAVVEHMLSVIYVYMELVFTVESGNSGAGLGGIGTHPIEDAPSRPTSPLKLMTIEQGTVGTPMSQSILGCIKNLDQSDYEGIHVDAICKNLDVDKEDISSFLNDLIASGEIFSTIDDKHFRAT